MTALSWLDVSDALDMLRVSEDNAEIVKTLTASIPAYVEVTTGYPSELVASDDCDEVVKQLCRMTLQLWYNPDGTDAPKLEAITNGLAKTVRAMGSSREKQ